MAARVSIETDGFFMDPSAAYWALFVSAFTSATLLPGSSEAVLLGFLVAEIGELWILVSVAFAGNLLGSGLTYAMGRWAGAYRGRSWFPVTPAQYDRAVMWYQRHGWWTLLLAWVPVIGDPLTVIAGAMRVPLVVALPLIAAGKLGRYLFIAGSYALWTA